MPKMYLRTKRLIFGAFNTGIAAMLGMGILTFDPHGAHNLPSLIFGLFVGAAAFYLGYANNPDVLREDSDLYPK